MNKFEEAFNFVLGEEGGYVNDPLDRGGATHHGISLRFLKSVGNRYDFLSDGVSIKTIKELTLAQAQEVYKEEFWDKLPYEEIEDSKLRNYFFHMVVNLGQHAASTCLQHALWALGYSRHYLADDGIFGPRTLNATNGAGMCLLPVLRAVRGAYYMNLARHHSEQKRFLSGWLNTTYAML